MPCRRHPDAARAFESDAPFAARGIDPPPNMGKIRQRRSETDPSVTWWTAQRTLQSGSPRLSSDCQCLPVSRRSVS